MKKLFLLFVFSIFAFTLSFAQTKKIANESHSGKKVEMRIDPDSYRDGNFGQDPQFNNPVYSEMWHYADSLRKVDSIRNLREIRERNYISSGTIPFQHYCDSMRKADSAKKANGSSSPPPQQSSKPKTKGIAANENIERQKK
jgi:hypothetical protein